MKIGCLLNIVLVAVLVTGYYYWFSQTWQTWEVWIGASAVAGIVWLSIGAWYNAWTAWSSTSALRAAQRGLPPRDGSWSALAGTIHATAQPASAPFSGKACVICEYDIARLQETDHTKRTIDFSGLIMVPCAVRGSAGTVKLYGFPDLQQWPETTLRDGMSMKRAKEFVRTNQWQDATGIKLLASAGSMWQALTDDESSLERSWRMISPASCSWLDQPTDSLPEYPEDEEDEIDDEDDADYKSFEDTRATRDLYTQWPYLHEKCVCEGEQVVAIGHYDGVRGGLVNTGTELVRLYRGEVTPILHKLNSSARAMFIGGLFALIAVHGFIFFTMWAYKHNNPANKANQAAITAPAEFHGHHIERTSVA